MIRTVTGDISPDALGFCHMHEHLLAAPPEPYATTDPDLVLDDEAAAAQELRWFYEAGGRAIVEMTPLDYSRNIDGLRRLSQQTGVQIIAVTGFLKDKFCAPFVEHETVESIATRFINDIENGAGVIKASSSLNRITPNEEKVFRAAAKAHHATGALISTHTEAGTMALEQIDLLKDVPPSKILIGHLDRNMDWDLHLAVAKRGVYLGYDQISKEKYDPDALRIEFIQKMIAAGHHHQLLLSMDLARKSYFPAYGGGPGLTYLRWRFVPWLRSVGVDVIDDLFVKNPARALSI
jgi:phosphotriesterase-related protein